MKRLSSQASIPQVRPKRSPVLGVVLALGLLGAGAYGVWRLGSGIVAAHSARPGRPREPPCPPQRPPRACANGRWS